MKRNADFGNAKRIGEPESPLLRSKILLKLSRRVTLRTIAKSVVPELNAIDGGGVTEPVKIVGSVRLERITENSEISFQSVCLTIPPFRYGAVRKNASLLPRRRNGSGQNCEDCRRAD